jgi:hypothetical protein
MAKRECKGDIIVKSHRCEVKNANGDEREVQKPVYRITDGYIARQVHGIRK